MTEILRKYDPCINVINEILVVYPDYQPAQLENIKVLILKGDWDVSKEKSDDFNEDFPNSIMGTKLAVFLELAHSGSLESSLEKLQQYLVLLTKKEGSNTDLFFSSAQLYSRICGRNNDILNLTIELTQRARKVKPLNAKYAVELAYQ